MFSISVENLINRKFCGRHPVSEIRESPSSRKVFPDDIIRVVIKSGAEEERKSYFFSLEKGIATLQMDTPETVLSASPIMNASLQISAKMFLS